MTRKAPRLPSIPARLAVLDTRTAKPAPKVGDPFYSSPAWIALRDAVLEARGHRCQGCGGTSGRMYVDHIVELSDGGAPLDPSNCQVLDASCHGRKTAAERAARQARRY